MLIWVDSWQQECCGDEFTVGEEVTWDCSAIDTTWLASIVGAADANSVEYAEEHHDDGTVLCLRGVVRHIDEVSCLYNVDSVTRIATPIPGSSTRRSVTMVSSSAVSPSGADLVGYIVTVDRLAE